MSFKGLKLNLYFLRLGNKYFEEYKNLFTKKEYFDELINTFINEIEHYQEHQIISETTIDFIRSLIPIEPEGKDEKGGSGIGLIEPNQDMGYLF